MADDSKPTPKELAALKAQKAEADRDKKETKAYKDSIVYPETEDVVNKAEILKNAAKAETDLRNYTTDLTLMDRSKIPPPDAQAAAQKEMYGKMISGAEHGFKPARLPGSNYGYATPPQWKGIEQSRKQGGSIKAYAKGGSIRGGGIEQRGKTKGRFV
jgi:cytochrome c1